MVFWTAHINGPSPLQAMPSHGAWAKKFRSSTAMLATARHGWAMALGLVRPVGHAWPWALGQHVSKDNWPLNISMAIKNLGATGWPWPQRLTMPIFCGRAHFRLSIAISQLCNDTEIWLVAAKTTGLSLYEIWLVAAWISASLTSVSCSTPPTLHRSTAVFPAIDLRTVAVPNSAAWYND